MRYRLFTLLALVGCICTVSAEVLDWPREITRGAAHIVVYQPQIESLKDNQLEGRAAVSITTAQDSAPVFGAIWFNARVDIDRIERTVRLIEIDVSRIRFPEADAELERQLARILEDEVKHESLEFSLDGLLADLEPEGDSLPGQGLNNSAPKIIVSHVPAVLILIDGDPIFEDTGKENVTRIVNTPYLLVHHKVQDRYYLNAGEEWFSTPDFSDSWRLEEHPPSEIVALTPTEEEEKDVSEITDKRQPQIIVATEPTELIFIDTSIKFIPVANTDLLYASNTDSDVLFDIVEQLYYVLLSGRWFTSTSLDHGPWTFIPSDQLPLSFSKIQLDSENGHLLASVAGTEEAQDAILDATIPQTAAIKRDATVSIEYDGEPQFSEIAGTNMFYAVNTPSSVLRISGWYYCCEEAVWYEAVSPYGPWKVSVKIPDEVENIPPSSPVHNVTYVHVYQSTPEVVYVGYTPGYVGNYVYHGSVVYGTGWHYRPWYRNYYYARPTTWGFHVRYNPWYGWSYGMSYGYGPFSFTIGHWGSHGWWGPSYYHRYPSYAYRHGYRHGYNSGYWHGYRDSYRNPGPRTATPRPKGVASTQTRPPANRNLYDRGNNRSRVVQKATPAQSRTSTNTGRSNNVYSDSNGNIFRRNNDGSWERRQQGGWSPSQTTPTTRQPYTTPSTRSHTQTERDQGRVSSQGSTRQPTSRSSSPSARSSSTSTPRQPTSTHTRSLEQNYSARQKGEQRSRSYQTNSKTTNKKPAASTKKSSTSKKKSTKSSKSSKSKKK